MVDLISLIAPANSATLTLPFESAPPLSKNPLAPLSARASATAKRSAGVVAGIIPSRYFREQCLQSNEHDLPVTDIAGKLLPG